MDALALVLELSPSGLGVTLGTIAVMLAVVYGVQAWARRKSRHKHVDVASTGYGSWDGRVHLQAVRQFQAAKVSGLKATFLDTGVPVRVDLSSTGIRVTITSMYLRKQPGVIVDAPWADVVEAVEFPPGHSTFGGKWSTVKMTDVDIVVTGASADRFLEYWDLKPIPGDTESTHEAAAEWMTFVRSQLGTRWREGTAVLPVRTSAPDGLVEAIRRQARGVVPS